MTIVRRPSPFGELMSLRSAMDRLFEDSFVRHPFNSGFDQAMLPLDVTSTADALIVEAAMPGIKPDDVEITVENGTLSIRGEQRQERREGEGESLVQEIRRSSVSRTVSLPSGLEPDKATASFEHGMLTLRIPKAEEVKPRQIRISPTVEGTSTASRDAKQVGNGRGSSGSTAETTAVGARSGTGDTSQSGPVGA
ncbi:MAG TPA: Hsp20/alpha crystallin family protein [Candidatus Limnocylindrales bacterium]|jgi:HSP20 family protein